MEKNLTPKIRFRGFTEPWITKRINDVSSSYSGGTPSVGEKTFYGGKIPFIRSGEISKNDTEIKITEDGLNNSSAKMVSKGDILYALYGATSGEVSISKINGAINQAVLAIIPNEGYSGVFINYHLRKDKNRITETYLQGGQGNLSGGIVNSLNIHLPVYSEQIKVGSFINDFELIIQDKNDEVEKLENVKQACMERMFPREGETTPQLRFKGFTDNWSFSFFGEKIQSHNFRPYIVTPTSCGSHPVIQQGDKSILGYADGIPYEDFKNVVLFGDHTVSLYKPIEPFFIATDGVKILSCKELIGSFFYYVLQRYAPKQEGYKRHFTILQGKRFYFPSLSEQEKIGNYFRHLDELIAAKRQEIEKLQDIKQSLLDKMFV